MKRILLAVFGIAALALAGSVFAQTGSGTTDQPGSTAPTYQPPPPADQGSGTGAQPATDTTSQPAAAPAPTPMQAGTGSSNAPGEAGTTSHSGKLPATASNNPLLALIGVLALGAFTILLVVRRRGAAQS